MTEQLKEIGMRLTSLREVNQLSAEQMAEKLDLDIKKYPQIRKRRGRFLFQFFKQRRGVTGVWTLWRLLPETPPS